MVGEDVEIKEAGKEGGRKARERREREAVYPRKFYEHLTPLLIQPRAEKI